MKDIVMKIYVPTAPTPGTFPPACRGGLLVLFLLFSALLLPADTAEGPAQGVLRVRLDFSALTGHGGWDAEGRSVPDGVLNYTAPGFDLEYGVIPWASLFARWQPGYLFSVVTGEGDAGRLGDFRFGLRLGLLGEQALIKIGFLRLAVFAGVKTPFPSGDDTAWEPDTHLWGAAFGLSFDYIPLSWFQVNLSGDVLLNPEQISDNPAFGRRRVNHPLDTTFILEPRFSILKPDGITFALPVVYDYSLESEFQGQGRGDERRFLSAGYSYSLVSRNAAWPFEVTARYLFPLYGMNQLKLHRLDLSTRIEIPLLRK
jgi:hypothetical protein